MKLFLCGDVMTGRGIDQILPHPGRPDIYEPYLRSAQGYVELAEQLSGSIKRPVAFDYIWGEALAEWRRLRPAVRIVNLETAVTSSEDRWPGKGIHYRMHPANVPALCAAGINCCVLANNHVLDWGYSGLAETLAALRLANIQTVGAGHNVAEAAAPARIAMADRGRVLVFAYGLPSSGVVAEWAAGEQRPGVNWLSDLHADSAELIGRQVRQEKRPGDVALVSLHWGGNWGFDIPDEQRSFAHSLIDAGGVDLVYGHSSHHVKGVEVYRGRAILYGAGDFLNDYEGIRGYGEFRGDLALMYFPSLDAKSGSLTQFEMIPTQTRRFQVHRAPEAGARWLLDVLNREGEALGTRAERQVDGTLLLRWT